MKTPPPHLVEPSDPLPTRRDRALIGFFFLGVPLAVAAILWCNA